MNNTFLPPQFVDKYIYIRIHHISMWYFQFYPFNSKKWLDSKEKIFSHDQISSVSSRSNQIKSHQTHTCTYMLIPKLASSQIISSSISPLLLHQENLIMIIMTLMIKYYCAVLFCVVPYSNEEWETVMMWKIMMSISGNRSSYFYFEKMYFRQ